MLRGAHVAGAPGTVKRRFLATLDAGRAKIARTMIALLLIACTSGKVVLTPGGGAGDDSAVEPGPTAEITGPAVFDPVLGGPVELAVSADGVDQARAVLLDAAGAELLVLSEGAVPATLGWDGHLSDGALAPVGEYRFALTDPETGESLASHNVSLVRVGLSAGTLGGDRIPLMWFDGGGPGLSWDDGGDSVTFALSALVDEAGVATSVPAVYEDLDDPPAALDDINLPAAYPYDARPTLSLLAGGEIASTTTAAITVAIDGWTATAPDARPGSTAELERDAALADGPRVVEETLVVQWLADGELFASQDVPIRVYATLDWPTFDSSEAPYVPWVAAVDPALRYLDGVAPDATAVRSGLVEFVYTTMDLVYDTSYGASYYTSYGGGWDSQHMNFSSFLRRGRGSIVNCSDCSGILSAYSNMLGAPLNYAIIEPSFQLNEIKAIGVDEFTSCPFGSWGCGFSYHAVTSPDEARIYDATLALDGDEDPGESPSTELLVQDISVEEYLERLVRSGSPTTTTYSTGTLQ